MKREILVKNLIAHFGSQASTAEALNVKQPTVSAWLRGTHGISALTALRIERVTEGKFKAVDFCHDLAAA